MDSKSLIEKTSSFRICRFERISMYLEAMYLGSASCPFFLYSTKSFNLLNSLPSEFLSISCICVSTTPGATERILNPSPVIDCSRLITLVKRSRPDFDAQYALHASIGYLPAPELMFIMIFSEGFVLYALTNLLIKTEGLVRFTLYVSIIVVL